VFISSSLVNGQTVLHVYTSGVTSTTSTTSSLVSSIRISAAMVESHPHTDNTVELRAPAMTTELTGAGHVTLTPLDAVVLGAAVATPLVGYALRKRFRL
jgi:hypothetical protein